LTNQNPFRLLMSRVAPSDEIALKEFILKNGFSRVYYLSSNPKLMKKLKEDAAFVLQVSERHQVLQHIPNSNLLEDDKFVIKILKNQPLDLKYASFQPKNDKETIIHCVKKNFMSFVFAPFVLKDDYDFVMELSEIDLRVFKYASNRIRSSPELMRKSVEKDKRFLQFIDDSLKSNVDLFKDIIEEDGDYVKYFNPSFIKEEIWLIACKSSPTALESISRFFHMKEYRKKTLDCEEFMKKAIELRGSNYFYASTEIQSKKEIELMAVSGSGEMLKRMPKEFRNDIEIVSNAIKNNPKSLKHASNDLKDNKSLVIECVKKNPYSFIFASSNLKNDIEIHWIKKRYFKLIREVNLLNVIFMFE
jgi:hypothetical protein